jgi:hypothetical protein
MGCNGALASALLSSVRMPAPSPRDDAPAADDDATTLQDLQAELGEVEWFGRRSLPPQRERVAPRRLRWRVPALSLGSRSPRSESRRS